MATLPQVLFITFVAILVSGLLSYIIRVKKVTRKDYKASDYAKTKRPDTSIGL